MSTDGAAAADQARMYLGANRPLDAVRILNGALAASPDDPELLRLLAQSQLAGTPGRAGGANALPAAQRAITLDPNDAHAWRLAALSFSRLGAHVDATMAARTARSLEPDHWVSHTIVAHADATAKHVSADTHASVAEAIRLSPNNPEVHFAAGHVAQVGRKFREAQQHYARTLAIDPDHVGARNNMALISMRRGNAGRAVAGFAGLLASNPNSELALRNLRATGFNALRFVYFVLAIAVIVMNSFTPGYGEGSDHEIRIAGIIVALVALACVAGYVIWIRNRAGVYFARFVRSVPATDRLLAAWALILLVCLAALIAAVFLPFDIAVTVYTFTEVVLVGSAIVVTLVNSSRRRRMLRG